MKDSISVIFAGIVFVFLVVILPLFSVMDRQDNMAYNTVLTQTTNFVDEVRTNGFITEENYNDYIAGLFSTGNTYKVILEVYKTTLLPTNDDKTEFSEEQELYNTIDITNIFAGNQNSPELDNSNKDTGVFLLNENDEFYVRVYNTNITTGSMLYNVFAGAEKLKSIDLTYGGRVDSVNWELYNKVMHQKISYPEVAITVPVNADGKINLQQLVDDEVAAITTCQVGDLYGIFAQVYEYCSDVIEGETYVYEYNLNDLNESNVQVNRTIKMAVELKGVTEIDLGSWVSLSDPELAEYFDDDGINDAAEQYMINNYIQLNGMTANIDIDVRSASNYKFDIILTDVKLESLANISSIASVSILSGLGRNIWGELTLGAESVKMQLIDKIEAKTTEILGPYNWDKLIKTQTLNHSTDRLLGIHLTNVYNGVSNNINYETIFYKILYTGINDLSPNDIIDLIKESPKLYIDEIALNNDLVRFKNDGKLEYEFFTPRQMAIKGITVESNSIILKIKLINRDLRGPAETNNYRNFRIGLIENWYQGMLEAWSLPAKEVGKELEDIRYKPVIYYDNTAPRTPDIILSGEKENEWYTSDVTVTVDASDRGTSPDNSPSGIWKNLVTASGANVFTDVDSETNKVILTENGISTIKAKSVDYVGLVSSEDSIEVKIDKKSPTSPTIKAIGIKNNDWYDKQVTIKITGGSDEHSGVQKTTYQIQGANAKAETNYTGEFTLSNAGVSKIIATTYDVAGNKTSNILEVKIDNGEAPSVTFNVVSGIQKDPDSGWYTSGVKLRITVNYTGSENEAKYFRYEVKKADGTSEIGLDEISTTNVKDILIPAASGEYVVYVYTYTADEISTRISEQALNLDLESPNNPDIDITSGKEGENGWYISDVIAKVTLKGDNLSGEKEKYTYQIDGGEVVEGDSGTSVNVSGTGEHEVLITTSDIAGNKLTKAEVIKIDTSLPTAEFSLTEMSKYENGELRGNGVWHNTDVYISYINGSDEGSGFERAEVIPQSLVEETGGTEVLLEVHDYAGNINEIKQVIKIDKTAPGAPEINLSSKALENNKLQGINLYNSSVTVSIKDGVDDRSSKNVNSGAYKTFYTIKKDGNIYNKNENVEYTSEIILTENGTDSIVAETSDNAGNVSDATDQTLIINTTKPAVPKVIGVNGEYYTGSTIYIGGSEATITISNFEGEVLTATVNGTTYTSESSSITLNFTSKGTYTITLTQTSIFDLTSESTTITYIYE